MNYVIPNAEPIIDKEDIEAVVEALKEKRLSQGEYVEEFEKEFAQYTGTKEAIALSSGTAALHVGLAAMGIKNGDEVITTPFTFAATANVIVSLGAKPVFADIDLETFNINPTEIKKKITKRTKAIIPVHYAGQCADMDEIMEIAEEHGIFVLEDAAEAHGALYKGRKAGSLAHAAAFSFYPNKNMTTGEGGMLTTNNEELAEKARILANHGQDSRYHHIEIGWNYKMPDFVAALGRVQLKRLDCCIDKKNRIAEYYTKHLKDFDGIYPPVTKHYNKHTFMMYPIRARNNNLREKLRQNLEKKGVETRICFPSVHLQPVYKACFGFKLGDFPLSELASDTVLCLPIFPNLRREKQKFILEIIKGTMESM
jgi:dTDP-4-amino-4,6-dideoxygalactose transaminase